MLKLLKKKKQKEVEAKPKKLIEEDGKKFCARCSRTIDPKDKWVLLGTYKEDETLEELYYHFACWKEYFKDAVEKKVGSMMNMVTKQFGKAVGQYKEIYG